MKKLFFSCSFFLFSLAALPQSIIGSWQLMKQTNCMEKKLETNNEETAELVHDMKSMNNKSPQILRFKDNQNGEESTRMLFKSKASNSKNFLYKLNESTLYILDKRSHTITDSFAIDALQSDSLILSNVSRPCETRVFVRVK